LRTILTSPCGSNRHFVERTADSPLSKPWSGIVSGRLRNLSTNPGSQHHAFSHTTFAGIDCVNVLPAQSRWTGRVGVVTGYLNIVLRGERIYVFEKGR
jgi:hypothetical protein